MKLPGGRFGLGLALAGLALALAGCTGAEPDRVRSAPDPSPSEAASITPASEEASPAATQPPTPDETAEPTAAPSPAPAAGGRATMAARLLTAEELPGFNDEFSWREAGTRRDEGGQPFGTCHKFAMTSIGATRVVVREYRPTQGPGADTASHLVADFPDKRTARRAFEVLRSWRGSCEEELTGYDRSDVGGLLAVDPPGTDAAWYLLTYGPAKGGSPDEGYFDAQGLTRVGRRVAVLQMRLVGQDYNYPAGEEPMVAAVRTASQNLG